MKKTSDEMLRNLLNLKEDYTLELDPHSDQLFVEREQLHEDDAAEDSKPEEKVDDESSDQENDESNESENDESNESENDEVASQENDETNDEVSDQESKEDSKDKDSEQTKDTEKKETHKLNMVPNVQEAYEDLERAATASDVAISIAKYLKALKSAAQDAISGSN